MHGWANIRRSLHGLLERALDVESEDLGSSPTQLLPSLLSGPQYPHVYKGGDSHLALRMRPDVHARCLSMMVTGHRGDSPGRTDLTAPWLASGP